ncbi:MAG: prolyl-tRNA synthetase [Parcubacteria group bacterium]|nr:prolyl-tRNA synthetase [Parcubacteria group bacterium]
MNALGAEEIFLPSLHPKENWETTGRWGTMDDLYKVTDASGRESALGPTHEEIITPLAKKFISSYRDLPKALFQIQNKFRMELRAKSGLLRGREFLMKDLYSFHTDNEGDFEKYYSRVQEAYKNIFRRAGIGEVTFLTYAAGGSFSKYSHEFQTLTPAGEDTIYLCEKCGIAINDEIIVAQTSCPECGLDKERLRKERAVEVGNIFPLKTKFTEAFGVTYKDKDGAAKLVVMGCYGIGLGRLMGAIVEVHADEKGLSWPVEVAPFQMHLIYVGNENGEAKKKADTLYEELKSVGIEVLYDDRDMSAGVKFSDAELIGIPQMVIVGEKTLETGKFEVRTRGSGEVFFKDAKELFQIVA